MKLSSPRWTHRQGWQNGPSHLSSLKIGRDVTSQIRYLSLKFNLVPFNGGKTNWRTDLPNKKLFFRERKTTFFNGTPTRFLGTLYPFGF